MHQGICFGLVVFEGIFRTSHEFNLTSNALILWEQDQDTVCDNSQYKWTD